MSPRTILTRGAWKIVADVADVFIGAWSHVRAAAVEARDAEPAQTSAPKETPEPRLVHVILGGGATPCPNYTAKRAN